MYRRNISPPSRYFDTYWKVTIKVTIDRESNFPKLSVLSLLPTPSHTYTTLMYRQLSHLPKPPPKPLLLVLPPPFFFFLGFFITASVISSTL